MKPYYYVYRVGDRLQKTKHFSLASAKRESERISDQHHGDTFEILCCVGITQTTTPQTFWMDGVNPGDES